jgi:hypothetical protein
LKNRLNRTATIGIAAGVGLIVGMMFMPAIADSLNPFPSASPTPFASESPTEGTDASGDLADPNTDPNVEPTPAPEESQEPGYVPATNVIDALEAVYRGQVWLQIADVYRELCLDEGDYGHVQQMIDEYTASGDLQYANLYQQRLDEHNALVDSSNEQLAILNDRLNDAIVTHGWALHDEQEAVYQAKLDRSRVESSLNNRIKLAKLGAAAARDKGLTTDPWDRQLRALQEAKSEFARSRGGF